MELENNTPFEAGRYAVCDRDGADLLLVVLKAAYTLDGPERVRVADEQQPIELADQHYGDPGASSIRYASDFSINKPGTDVAVIGHAYPTRPGETAVNAGIQVGPVEKLVRVFGDRFWKQTVGVSRMSSPAPFERMPLVYERAFGGADTSHSDEKHHDFEPRNPVGVGFRAKKSKLPVDDAPLPNIEDPGRLISSPNDRPPPAGLGFIGPAWEPRRGHAGTYDEAWEERRKPLLPDDFSERFFNAAHPDLVTQEVLHGDEEVTAIGVSADGPIQFFLPGVQPQCAVEEQTQGEQPVALRLDKVVLEPDEARVLLVWSGTLRIPGAFQDIDVITFNLPR